MDDPYEESFAWSEADYPPMGPTGDVIAELNRRVREAGLVVGPEHFDHGVLLPDGVESVTVCEHDGQLRFLLINDPTGEQMEILADMGEADDWRIYDAGTGDEILTDERRMG